MNKQSIKKTPGENNHEREIYTSLEQEYDALCNGVGYREVTTQSVIEFTGADTLDFIHRITTNDVTNLVPGKVRRTIVTNENGRIIDRITLLYFRKSLIALCSKVYQEILADWLKKYIIMDDVTAKIDTENYTVIEVIGPDSIRLLQSLNNEFSSLPEPMNCIDLSIGPVQCTLIALEPISEKPRTLLLTDNIHRHQLLEYIETYCAEFNVRQIGTSAYSAFRIINGIPDAPNELNDLFNPHEAGIIADVSFTKGCYIGQEVIARLDTYAKVQKHLCGVVISSDRVPGTPCKLITSDSKTAGDLTSTAYSPLLKQLIGLAYVKKQYNREGLLLFAQSADDTSYEVQVTGLPISIRTKS